MGGQVLDFQGFGDAESSLVLTPADERPGQNTQVTDAESGVPSVLGDARQSWYDLAIVVEDLRLEIRGALAKTQSDCESFARREAASREEHRAAFEAALLDVSGTLRDELDCVAREFRAGDAALGERIVGLSTSSPRGRSREISNDEARLQALSSQIRDKSQLFEEGRRVLEKQLGAIRKQLAGEQVVRDEFHASLEQVVQDKIGQLSRSRSQEDCASQALLIDTAVTKALAEQRFLFDALVVKQQRLMDERFAEQECSDLGRASHIEALVERWVGEEDKARASQASSTRASLDQFAEQLRGEMGRAQDEMQQTVTIDVKAAIAFHRQDISQSIEDLRVMLSAAPQNCRSPGGALLTVPESLAELAAETVVEGTPCPAEFAQLKKSSPGEQLRESSASLPLAAPSSSAAPASLRNGNGNTASMPSLLTRVAVPSPMQTMVMGSLAGSLRLPVAAPSSPRTVTPALSPCWAAPATSVRTTRVAAVTPPAASAIPGTPAQETRSPTLSARRLSPPPQSPSASMHSRRASRRTLSPPAPLHASHS